MPSARILWVSYGVSSRFAPVFDVSRPNGQLTSATVRAATSGAHRIALTPDRAVTVTLGTGQTATLCTS